MRSKIEAMSQEILELLQRKKLLTIRGELEMTRLTGGFWNELYRLRDGERDWVVKRFRAGARDGLYPVMPRAEALALETLRGHSIAPDPVAFIDEPGWQVLVYHFVEGNTWKEDVAAVARLLGRLHQVPVDANPGFRRLALEPVEILAQGDQLLAQADQDSWIARLRACRPKGGAWPPITRLSLVHTDAWAGNFIQDGEQVWLIDWQCPGLGDAAEDVWTFAASGYEMLLGRPGFESQDCDLFYAAYPDARVVERAHALSPCLAYRVAAHAILRHQQLAHQDPLASVAYLRVCDHLTATLSV